ncbi:MAG: S8 family serine peptidase [Endomicrobium sp.]|jgi:subtilisin family serine protease|nr:S8 family serine peptidase [Endomicrobium sp.]
MNTKSNILRKSILNIIVIMLITANAFGSKDSINATEFIKRGITGKGVKVAIIDYDFAGYSAYQENGSLPKNLIAMNFTVDPAAPIAPSYAGVGHGTSCAAIVYSIAPDCDMFLIDVGVADNAGRYERVRNYCTQEGIHIVSISLRDDIAFPDGMVDYCQEIDSYSDSNILAITITGNDADGRWFGELEATGGANTYFNFPNGTQQLDLRIVGTAPVNWRLHVCRSNKVTMPPGLLPHLYNFDLEVINVGDGVNQIIPDCSDDADPRGDFMPGFSTTPGDLIRIKVISRGGYNVRDKMGFVVCLGGLTLSNPAEANKTSSLTGPGHSRKSLTAGAIPEGDYNKNDLIGSFSGCGPCRAATDALGQVVEPECIKPEIVAPGNATSYAAPHVAGAAVLIAQIRPELLQNAQQFKDYIIDMHTIKVHTAPDNNYGYGKLYLNASILPPVPPTPTPPLSEQQDILVYPNPVSLSASNYLKIADISLEATKLDARIYNISGELIKSFSILELADDINKKMLRWDLRNDNGDKIAPGVYFITIKTDSTKIQIKKIAVKK